MSSSLLCFTSDKVTIDMIDKTGTKTYGMSCTSNIIADDEDNSVIIVSTRLAIASSIILFLVSEMLLLGIHYWV